MTAISPAEKSILAERCALDPARLDFTKRFILEEFTPLFHTSIYSSLSDEVRLRYNQLHALYFNEQVAFFEQEMLSPALRALLREPLPSPLIAAVQTFYEEEQRHTERFVQLNLRCASEFYAGTRYYFVRVSRPMQGILKAIASRPLRFPLLIWLALLQEERSLYFSRRCLERTADLEPHFVDTHRAHLADEVGHVRWDEELLDWLWPQTRPLMRWLNARLLIWMVREFFLQPKRSGLRVVQQLLKEHPRLDGPGLHQAMKDLAKNSGYLETLYSREITPRSFARFDADPEFQTLPRKLPGYCQAVPHR